jgi:hypothetical protein
MRTPIRDEFGLNDEASLATMNAAFASKRAEAARLAALRSDLKAGLSGLPAPQNEYQVSGYLFVYVEQGSCSVRAPLYSVHGSSTCIRTSTLAAPVNATNTGWP